MGAADRKAKHREGLRQEILDAARTLFVREGYENVSMRKIAEKVHYSPGTIYLYFKDKDEILECLCAETFAKLHERMAAVRDDEGPLLDRLRRGTLLYIYFGLENPYHYTVTFILSSNHIQPKAKARAGVNCFENLVSIVEKCIDAGLLNSTDRDATSQALWAAMHGLVALLIMHPNFPFVERTRLIERTVEMMIEGVRKR